MAEAELRPVLRDDYLALLKDSGLLAGIAGEDIDETIGNLQPTPRQYGDGQLVCRAGAKANCLWIVVQGAVGVKHGRNNLLDRKIPYIVGEQAIIEPDSTRSADLVAFGPTTLLEIGRTCVERLPPGILAAVWRNLAGVVSAKLRYATIQRSEFIDRDRDNTAIISRFLNQHQQGFVLAQGSLSAGHFPDKLEAGRFVILFSDVVGFSKLALRISPAETAEIIRRCMQLQSGAIEAADGYVDKFMGDGLMAYWPVPTTATPDDVAQLCDQALSAAIAAVKLMADIPVEGDKLGLRVGLHLGEAIAGNFGSPDRMQVTLLGPEVNAAARLEQARSDDMLAGDALADVRVSTAFYNALPEASRALLPFEATIKAKQADIDLRSGPPQAAI